MIRFVLFSFLFLMTSNGFAGIRELWDEMPDSILIHKSQASIENFDDVFMKVVVSSSLDVQLRLMPQDDAEDVIFMVKTYSAPEKESEVEVFDKNWNHVCSIIYNLEDVVGADIAPKVSMYFEPLLISAELRPGSDEVTLTVSDRNLNDEEKKELEGIVLQRKVKWNDKILK